MEPLRTALTNNAARERLYVCSLSAVRDSISQWQRYGADGKGYCVGLSGDVYRDFAYNDVMLRPIIYDFEEQRRLLEQTLDATASALEDAARRGISDVYDVVSSAASPTRDIIDA